jgi:glycerol-1-phosphate dehydrogenase [NAD(P)+]
MLLSPLFIDIRAGAVSRLGALLSDRRISADGHVAVAVGPGQGESVVEAIRPSLGNADIFTVRGGSLEAAGDLQSELRGKNYDALVGIGGGRTLDVAKYAATRLALPMVAVATNLAHDGIASPVSSLLHEGGKGSFGVGLPMAVVVDLDFVRTSPPRMVRSGIGDVVSNLTAVEDWRLAADERGEPIDGLAETFARTAAESVLHRDGSGRLQPPCQRRRPRDHARDRRAVPRHGQPR